MAPTSLSSRAATIFRTGFTRARNELRQSFSGTELLGHLLWPSVTLVALFFLKDRSFGDSGVALGTLVLPSVLGMFIAFGMLLTIQYLAADREDGTLLRAKATPNGIGGYLIGKLGTSSASWARHRQPSCCTWWASCSWVRSSSMGWPSAR